MATPDIRNMLAYCTSLALEFEARRNRVRNFVQNNVASGTANEAMLRSLLASISAGTLGVTDGFVCNPLRGHASRQCDILIFERRFPLVYAEGGVTVVWPESARMTVEVKTGMNGRRELKDAIENVASVKRIHPGGGFVGVVFAFSSLAPKTVFAALSALPHNSPDRPDAVLLSDRGAIIQQADLTSPDSLPTGEAPYQLRLCRGRDHSAHVLTYLLLLFLRTQLHNAPAFISSNELLQATNQFLSEYTVQVGEPG